MRNLPIRGPGLIPLACVVAFCLGACSAAPQIAVVGETAKPTTAAEDMQRVAEGALGMQAEVLAHGNLARNGLDQLLVVNRSQQESTRGKVAEDPGEILITRATIVQKDNGKWTEVLRCDEHLKNPNGYLGGSPTSRVTGWQLQIMPNSEQGLEMKFTPADQGQAIAVRWNAKTGRYQSLDHSEERYLSEVPALDTPQSVLR